MVDINLFWLFIFQNVESLIISIKIYYHLLNVDKTVYLNVMNNIKCLLMMIFVGLLSHWSKLLTLVVVCRASINNLHFKFIKTKRTIVIFSFEHLWDKKNLNFKIYDLTIPGSSWEGQICQKGQVFKIHLLFFHICE